MPVLLRLALRNPPSSQAPRTSHWVLLPHRCTSCSLVVAVAAGLAERQALALCAPAVLAAVVLASGRLCSRAPRFLLRTPQALCRWGLQRVARLGRA